MEEAVIWKAKPILEVKVNVLEPVLKGVALTENLVKKSKVKS